MTIYVFAEEWEQFNENIILGPQKSLQFLVIGLGSKSGAVMFVFFVIHVCAVIGTRPNFPYTKYAG